MVIRMMKDDEDVGELIRIPIKRCPEMTIRLVIR
jgi:hypothetical protein